MDGWNVGEAVEGGSAGCLRVKDGGMVKQGSVGMQEAVLE